MVDRKEELQAKIDELQEQLAKIEEIEDLFNGIEYSNREEIIREHRDGNTQWLNVVIFFNQLTVDVDYYYEDGEPSHAEVMKFSWDFNNDNDLENEYKSKWESNFEPEEYFSFRDLRLGYTLDSLD